jgi:hypothetical protein
MALIQRVVTLTQKGNSAGPSYRAQYSDDCVTYINTTGTSLINLPAIGSQATITFPDTALCLRLVNQNGACDNNFVVEVIGTTTTTSTSTSTTSTTSTTTRPTTTTSTTTLPTTTTSTTLAPCYQNMVVQVTNGDALNWLNCYGVSDGGAYPVGEHTLPGCIQPNSIVGDGETTFTITSFGTPCTTTTSTSTTSTTTLPTTTTTTTTLAPCYTGMVVQVTNGDALNWLTCYGISDGGAYPVGEHTLPGCIQPGTIVGDGETTFTITSYGTPCTTTTSTSTTSTTTIPPTCVVNTTINVTDTGWIRWTNCYGDIVDTFLSSLGTYTITQCIQFNTIRAAVPLADLANWNNVVWGTACTTTTSTTSTTTTPPTTALFNWNFIEGLGTGEMVLYINGNVVENRFNTSNGTYNVSVGDTINCEIVTSGCSSPNSAANAYCIGIINDASCGTGSTSLFTTTYEVTSGDIGNTITLSMYSDCDTGCV